MTVIRPNSVAGINSITVQSGDSLAVHKADGTLIRTLTSDRLEYLHFLQYL